jgi:hypothetical protein
LIVASWTPCDRSVTSSMEARRVAAMWRRSAASSSFGTLTRKGWIAPGLASSCPSCRALAPCHGPSSRSARSYATRLAISPRESPCLLTGHVPGR